MWLKSAWEKFRAVKIGLGPLVAGVGVLLVLSISVVNISQASVGSGSVPPASTTPSAQSEPTFESPPLPLPTEKLATSGDSPAPESPKESGSETKSPTKSKVTNSIPDEKPANDSPAIKKLPDVVTCIYTEADLQFFQAQRDGILANKATMEGLVQHAIYRAGIEAQQKIAEVQGYADAIQLRMVDMDPDGPDYFTYSGTYYYWLSKIPQYQDPGWRSDMIRVEIGGYEGHLRSLRVQLAAVPSC
jgi:hypothetical protein